jgi:phosphatidylglycerophosphate synthase
VPSLCITLTYHIAVAYYCYTQYAAGHPLTYTAAVAAHSLFAAVGLWVLLFGAVDGHIARKTGADRNASGFPLQNVKAEKIEKKEL